MDIEAKRNLCQRIMEADTSLLKYAKSELDRLNPEGDVIQNIMAQQLLEMVLVFSTHGHSGFSASYARSLLTRLLDWKPLSALTGEDDEWNEIDRSEPFFQNKRCGEVFKGPEGAYHSCAVVFQGPNGQCYASRGSRQPVEFPYYPVEPLYVLVDLKGNCLDGWNKQGTHPLWVEHVKANQPK